MELRMPDQVPIVRSTEAFSQVHLSYSTGSIHPGTLCYVRLSGQELGEINLHRKSPWRHPGEYRSEGVEIR